jgi:hypothetical protein
MWARRRRCPAGLVAPRDPGGRWPGSPLEWAIAAVRVAGSKIPHGISTIRIMSLAPGGCLPFGFFLWLHGRTLYNFRRRLHWRSGSHSMRSSRSHKRRLRVVDNRLRRRTICRETMTLGERRPYQPMETDRKYRVHAQTDRDDCCCRPKITAPRHGQTQEDTSQVR